VQENTADGTVDFGACPGDGNARALCESATHTADFRTLMNHLRATGFTLIAAPRPTLEVYEVRQDGTPGENVLVLRFAKEAAGQTALLRYGRDADGQHAATYAFVQEDATPTFFLAVDNGAVTKRPLNEHASHRARPSSRVNAEANPDNPNPYEGQANELCSECPVVCKTLGSIECGLIILVLSRGNKVAAATLGPLCSKPAEKACGPYCDSMIAPALEDDPQNCGACGHACSGQQVCCGGSCVGGTCPPGQHFDRATCKCACGPGLETCADHTCCDGQCTQYTCCPASQDFCFGTCCVPGYRCVKNGRHGICCLPEHTHDCYHANGGFLGCYDPAKCYCDTLAGKLVCNP
jgi:hypothetical protein